MASSRLSLDRAGLTELEPHVGEKAIGGVHYSEPLSTSDPAKLIQSYAALFVKRGGRMERGDALSLEPSGLGWMVTTDEGQARGARRRDRARALVR